MLRRSSGGTRAVRRSSLQREWARAFTVMLVVVLAAAAVSVGGVRALVDEVERTARQLHREKVALATLRAGLVSHEQRAHELLAGKPVDREAFARQQQALSQLFGGTAAVFPARSEMRRIVEVARRSWEVGLRTYGLWGAQTRGLRGDRVTANRLYGASSDATYALLDSVDRPSLSAMDRGLAHGSALERLLILVLSALSGLALCTTVYFRRRMAKDLIQPLRRMHDGVMQLEAGRLTHEIQVSRRDELGELTEAFNDMAAALYASHEALTFRASHDPLTGLPNRAALMDRLTTRNRGDDERTRPESLLFLDIDNFKEINDALGHEGGDRLLVLLAGRLQACVRPGDLVARISGDEFAVVVAKTGEPSSAGDKVAARILRSVRRPFEVDSVRSSLSVSIGVAELEAGPFDATELLRRADFAMYTAKYAGKGCYRRFDAEMHERMLDRAGLKADLARAVALDQLRLVYQPVVHLRTGRVVGAEALVRWEHPTRGLLEPAAFITLAEETGTIDEIGCWVLETASRDIERWEHAFPECANLWVSVNLSAFQLPRPTSIAAVQRILTDRPGRAGRLVLEITETALASEVDGGIASITALKNLGARIAIDDFGTGFSSLSTLADLPVAILKIDRSFVSGGGAPSGRMLEGILGLAEKLSLETIAEGIERREQLELLRDLGCELGQGYLLARPLGGAAFEELLASGSQLHIAGDKSTAAV